MLTDHCFVCGNDNEYILQKHHIIPNRYGGSDKEENLVRLCPNCHEAIEKIYNQSFYHSLGIPMDEKEGEYTSVIVDQRSAMFPREAPDLKSEVEDVNMKRWLNEQREHVHALENMEPTSFSGLSTWKKYELLVSRHKEVDEILNGLFKKYYPQKIAEEIEGAKEDVDEAPMSDSVEESNERASIEDRMAEIGLD